MMSRPISISPGFGLNGLRSTSQLRSRAPSLSIPARRLALTKIRRRWLVATNPSTRGATPRATGDDDDVVEPADGRAAGVEQRQAHDSERVDQLACHGRKATPASLLSQDALTDLPGSGCGDLHERVGERHATAPFGQGVVGE